jgi:hypothetical protein
MKPWPWDKEPEEEPDPEVPDPEVPDLEVIGAPAIFSPLGLSWAYYSDIYCSIGQAMAGRKTRRA